MQVTNAKTIARVILLGLMIAGLYEGVVGVLQVAGIMSSGHALYPATGTFFNPGPCCGFVAMLLPLAVHHILKPSNRAIVYLAYLCLFVSLFIMPILMGRTGWVAAVIGCGYVYVKHRKPVRTKTGILAALALVCIGGVALYFLKPASALGRFFLWRLGVSAFVNGPLMGVGWDHVAGAIGAAQENYFGSHPDSVYASVAGSPEFAFNEFLQIAIAYGIAALIAVVLLFLCSFYVAAKHKEYGLAGAVLAAVVVCMASYPLQFREYIVAFSAMLVATVLMMNKLRGGVKACVTIVVVALCCGVTHQIAERQQLARQWQSQRYAYQYRLSACDAQELDSIHAKMRWSKNFLFDYGKVLRNNGRLEQSIAIMQEGVTVSSDAMFLNLIGRNYYDLKQYDIAAEYYCRSITRLPGRLYPYYLLAKLYADSCSFDAERFSTTYSAAMQLTPKVKSPAIRQMHEELIALNDSIQRLQHEAR